ncbi:unnamed protein product [Trifolium pratense]|uniref:Uncharacterized protein n=1 Tax=Trifolium pratense TaxID=57577 RepID=A0ACB0KEG9_TRIPR|nr:unnamed protein product [Trifolium pratense]
MQTFTYKAVQKHFIYEMQNKKNMAKTSMFVYAMMVFLFSYLALFKQIDDIPCKTVYDCPSAIGHYEWECYDTRCRKFYFDSEYER